MTFFVYLSNIDDWTNSVNGRIMSESKKDRVLAAAREVFLRYGYKRVSMADIAEAAGMSRPALYLIFKNKEEIFSGVFLKWVDETITDIESGMMALTEPERKLEYAFEIWAVQPFDIVSNSPEAKELLDCTFGFAEASQIQGYARFESTIAPVLDAWSDHQASRRKMDSDTIAHVLASAVLGFKQTAKTKSELRQLIKDLLTLSLPPL